jgi:hypothetical protein
MSQKTFSFIDATNLAYVVSRCKNETKYFYEILFGVRLLRSFFDELFEIENKQSVRFKSLLFN